MQICLEILDKYPEVEIGYLVARVCVKKSDPFVDSLKRDLRNRLQSQRITATNFTAHPSIALWRKIYEEDFHVKASTYRSSIEALLHRVVTGKEVWNICTVVDLYNCCSILSLLPMGGYDLHKISGDIYIRFAKKGEPFLGLGQKEPIAAEPEHVVYADEKGLICWLWNHKDAAQTCIDQHSEYVLFFIDAFDREKVQAALQQLAENLEKIACTPLESGILSKSSPQVNVLCY